MAIYYFGMIVILFRFLADNNCIMEAKVEVCSKLHIEKALLLRVLLIAIAEAYLQYQNCMTVAIVMVMSGISVMVCSSGFILSFLLICNLVCAVVRVCVLTVCRACCLSDCLSVLRRCL